MIQRVIEILVASGQLLWTYLPYILLGVLISEILKYTHWDKIIKKAVSRSPALSIVIASILGIVSPLCTIGTIPIVINLYRNKVSLSPLLTFLSASSLMNPQLFLITWAGLGIELALIRLIGVIIFTLLLGYIISLSEKKLLRSKRIVNSKIKDKCDVNSKKQKFNLKTFTKSYYNNLEHIGFYIVLGILISVVFETFIPLSMIFEITKGIEWINVIAASFLGIPLYVCGGATIPLINVLLENGISAGAAIGFLIVGPGTRITALVALGSFLSKKTIGYYVVALLLYSIVLGLSINWFLGV